MNKQTFAEEEAYFPVTMAQFESLVNEMLTAANVLSDPHFMGSDYMAQVVMSVIHSIDRRVGILNKTEIFERCIHAISCHVTHHVVQEIQEKIKLDAAKAKEPATGEPTLAAVPDESFEH